MISADFHAMQVTVHNCYTPQETKPSTRESTIDIGICHRLASRNVLNFPYHLHQIIIDTREIISFSRQLDFVCPFSRQAIYHSIHTPRVTMKR